MPAVNGLTGLLNSALKHGTKVRRVIHVSSICAIQNRYEVKPTIYNETHWNDICVELSNKLGREATPFDKYEASKTLSERAGWEFMEKHKRQLKFDLVATNPALILGPGLQEVRGLENLNTSLQMFYDAVPMNQSEGEAALKPLYVLLSSSSRRCR